MKSLKVLHLIYILSLIPLELLSQYGYIKLNNDTTIKKGYVKKHTNPANSVLEFEIWETKKDKNPRRLLISDIYEYAIDAHIFRILHDYPPFMGFVEAEVISRGRVDLLALNPKNNQYPQLPTYVLENTRTNYMRTLSRKDNDGFEVLRDFIPDNFLNAYVRLYGNKGTYEDLAQIVSFYNQGVLINSTSIKKLNLKQITFNEIGDLITNAEKFIGKNEYRNSLKNQLEILFGQVKISESIQQSDTARTRISIYEVNCGIVSLFISTETELVTSIHYAPKEFITNKRPVKNVTSEEIAKFIEILYQELSKIENPETKSKVAFELTYFEDRCGVLITTY